MAKSPPPQPPANSRNPKSWLRLYLKITPPEASPGPPGQIAIAISPEARVILRGMHPNTRQEALSSAVASSVLKNGDSL